MSDPSIQMVPHGIDGFGPDRYGESFADVYDDWYDDVSDAEATAAFINQFGGAQRVLELGVGTGRLSKPIAELGHLVVGVDASTAMLDRFRSSPGSQAIGGDMQFLPTAAGVFDLVLVATNTLFNLPSADAQFECLVECRRTLRLGGILVVEAMIPAAPDPALDRLVTTRSIAVDHVVLTATIRDPDSQNILGQHIEITEAGIRLRPWSIHYSTPDQLDEIATSAGFVLGDRTANWDGAACTDASSNAVSVYVAV